MSAVFDGVGKVLRWFAISWRINCFCSSFFVSMSLYFSIRLFPRSFTSFTTVMRAASSQNLLKTGSSVHCSGGFLVKNLAFSLPCSIRTSKKEVLSVTRFSSFSCSDSLVNCTCRGVSDNTGRCRFRTIFAFIFDETLSSKGLWPGAET